MTRTARAEKQRTNQLGINGFTDGIALNDRPEVTRKDKPEDILKDKLKEIIIKWRTNFNN